MPKSNSFKYNSRTEIFQSDAEIRRRFNQYFVLSIIIAAVMTVLISQRYYKSRDSNFVYSIFVIRLLPFRMSYRMLEKLEEFAALFIVGMKGFIITFCTAVICLRRKQRRELDETVTLIRLETKRRK